MHNPLEPRRPDAAIPPPVQRPVGITADGQYIYPLPPAAPIPQQGPLVARPWGAYIAGGCLGIVALALLAAIVLALVFGFALLMLVLALAAVALTICLLVLRNMWRDSQRS
ncbi:hypothetical protein ACIBL6_16015 [Streptomyces sp. NPDC050400]|uniref:hypothetical protein n=1 Tax=unclassified Streptomyces TaxID=2593676 RepID=UPI003556B1DB